MQQSDKTEQIRRAKRFVGRIQDYRKVFGSAEGKRVLYDVMKHGHMLDVSYVRGDPHETSFREGERNMALMIMTKLNIDVDQLKQHIENGEQNE
jgi:hypothetical protein